MFNDKKRDQDENGNDRNHKNKSESGRSIAARFGSAAEAREAIAALHKEHYTHTWLGTTSVAKTDTGDEAVTVESGGGFFSQTHSLVDALVSHGVLGDTARKIEATIEPGEALLTVDPKDRDVLEAISLVEQHGGHIAGHTIDADADLWLTPSQSRISPVRKDERTERFGAEDAFYQRGRVTR
jgi:hypothetical protein